MSASSATTRCAAANRYVPALERRVAFSFVVSLEEGSDEEIGQLLAELVLEPGPCARPVLVHSYLERRSLLEAVGDGCGLRVPVQCSSHAYTIG